MTQTAHILLVKCMWALWLYYLESPFLRNSPKLLWLWPINCRLNDFFSTLGYKGVAFGHFDRFYQMNEIINWVNNKNCYKIDKKYRKNHFYSCFLFYFEDTLIMLRKVLRFFISPDFNWPTSSDLNPKFYSDSQRLRFYDIRGAPEHSRNLLWAFFPWKSLTFDGNLDV